MGFVSFANIAWCINVYACHTLFDERHKQRENGFRYTHNSNSTQKYFGMSLFAAFFPLFHISLLLNLILFASMVFVFFMIRKVYTLLHMYIISTIEKKEKILKRNEVNKINMQHFLDAANGILTACDWNIEICFTIRTRFFFFFHLNKQVKNLCTFQQFTIHSSIL